MLPREPTLTYTVVFGNRALSETTVCGRVVDGDWHGSHNTAELVYSALEYQAACRGMVNVDNPNTWGDGVGQEITCESWLP